MEPNHGPVSSSVPQFLSKKNQRGEKIKGEEGETKKMVVVGGVPIPNDRDRCSFFLLGFDSFSYDNGIGGGGGG